MKLGITCIVKDEAPYIEEWLWFHHLQGFDIFYIYLNNCTDNTRDILQKLVTKLQIRIHDWPGEKMQLPAYNHAIKKYRRDVDWMAFIDVDEFLHSTFDLPVKVAIEKYSLAYLKAGVLMARWVLFGSSGHKEYSPELVLERFTHRAPEEDKHCKSIVRMQMVIATGWESHTFKTEGEVIDEYGTPYIGPYAVTDPKPALMLRINHYHTKSEAEYKAKCAKGRSDIGTGRVFEKEFEPHDRNEVYDPHLRDIYAYLIKDLMK